MLEHYGWGRRGYEAMTIVIVGWRRGGGGKEKKWW